MKLVRRMTWLKALDFDSSMFLVGSSGTCILPWTSIQQIELELSLPLLLIAELLLIFAVHTAYLRFRKRKDDLLSSYIRTLVALGLFSYSSMSALAFRMLNCVDVFGKHFVLWSNPDVSCWSDEYA